MSIVQFMILLAFFVFRATVLFDKSDVKASRQSFVRKLSVAEPYNPFSMGFNFAFGIGKDLDPSIGVYTSQNLQYQLSDALIMDKLTRSQRDASKQTNIFIQRNLIKLQDDYIQYGQSQDKEFFQIQKALLNVDDNAYDNLNYIRAFIRMDKNYDIYERQIYSLGQILGELGGLKTSLFLIFSTLVGIYAQKIAYLKISQEIFQVKSKHHKVQKNQKIQATNFIQEQGKKKFTIEKEDMEKRRISAISQPQNKSGYSKENQKLDKSFIKTIVNDIVLRSRFSFSISEYIWYIMSCFNLNKLRKIRNKKIYNKKQFKSELKKSYKFAIAQDKIQQELDVVSIIKKLRSLDTMMKFMFNPLERLALKYQKQNVLDSSSDYEGKAEETALKSKDIKFLKVLENNNSHSFTKKFLKKKLGYYLNRKSSRQTSAPNIELIKGIASKSSNVEIYDELRKSSGKLPNKEPLNIEGSIDFSKLGIELITPSLASSNNHSPNDQSINNEEITEQNLEQSTFQVDKTHLEDSTQRLAQNSASRFLSIKSYKRPKKNISNVDLFNVPEKELLGSSTKITKTPNIQKKFKY
eukprot:403372316